MNNLRHLAQALSFYTQENSDFFPPNPDDGNTVAGHNWCAGQAGVGGADEFNSAILTNAAKSLLAPYLRSDASVFRCTLDSRVGRAPQVPRPLVPAARTVSLNHAVGTVCTSYGTSFGHNGRPDRPTNGPWLTGSHGVNAAYTGPWRTYGKAASIAAPAPANLWTICEEDPKSLNDAGLATSVGTPKWVDFPSTLHDMGGVLAFADGHVELHHWVVPSTRVKGFPSIITVSAENADWLWFSQRTSAPLR
jgi:hypothetical protein